jgi:hypothetical protein
MKNKKTLNNWIIIKIIEKSYKKQKTNNSIKNKIKLKK